MRDPCCGQRLPPRSGGRRVIIGVWLGGFLYERTGSYDVVWWRGVGLGIFAALVHVPIREKQWS
jgi:hypothetical protein